MSGGSYDYLYQQVRDAVKQVSTFPQPYPEEGDPLVWAEYEALRLAFASHLFLVAEALHAIEWHDSADWGPAECLEPLRAVMRPRANDIVNESLERAKRAARSFLAVVEAIQT
jgi:hypothetical protein